MKGKAQHGRVGMSTVRAMGHATIFPAGAGGA